MYASLLLILFLVVDVISPVPTSKQVDIAAIQSSLKDKQHLGSIKGGNVKKPLTRNDFIQLQKWQQKQYEGKKYKQNQNTMKNFKSNNKPTTTNRVPKSTTISHTVLASDLSKLNTTLFPRLSPRDSFFQLCDQSWHSDYNSMHKRAANILNSVSSEQWTPTLFAREKLRVFIYIAREGHWEKVKSGGVGDRFSLVGMFAMCLVHNTAFFIDYPGLSDAFHSGYGGLSWKVNASGYIAKYSYSKTVLHFPDLYGKRPNCKLTEGEHLCRDITLDTHIAQSAITIARTARGKITTMFKEPYYKNMLSRFNMKHESAFGCLFDYLFQPSDLLKKMFSREIELLESLNAIKILLQIRAGDAAISKSDNSDHFNHKVLPVVSLFTDCAKAVELKVKSMKRNFNKTVYWYVMTDSTAARDYIKSNFSDKVIIHNSTIQNLMTESYMFQSFAEVLGEQWCGGLADYFIVSRRSGLGRQAAFRSKHLRNRVISLELKYATQCSVVENLFEFGSENSQI